MVDAATLNQGGGILMVFLDWAKAFDRLKPQCLCGALVRFGIPLPMVRMIEGIYSERFFTIVDHCGCSTERRQAAGIAQGCPLSPYLFIAVQTVMLHDVYRELHLQREPAFVVSRDVLYADDTV